MAIPSADEDAMSTITSGVDLTRWPGVGRWLRWRHARAVAQWPLFIVALAMIAHGLLGPQLAPKNLATVLTWVHLRGLVVVALLVAGNLFCLACPFMLPRQWLRRWVRPRRVWPRWLRGKVIAVALFAAFLFAYELFDLWASPWWTAWLIVGYFALALVIDGLFRGAAFCKHVCPLGQFNFTGSLISPLEIAVREPALCKDCHTKDCIRGRGRSGDERGCELWLFQPRKVGNMDCTFCLDCVHACPYDNVGVLARMPGEELWSDAWRSGIGRFSERPDVTALIALFVFGGLMNAFGMVSPIYALERWLARALGTGHEAPVLGLIFATGLIIEPFLLIGASAWATRRMTGSNGRLLTVAARYVPALAPLGMGIWAGHYAFHFLTGFWAFIPVIQSALIDAGLRWWARPRWDLGPLVSGDWLLPLEWGLMGLGWLGTLLVAHRIAEGEAPDHRWRAFAPWAVLATLLLAFGLWLMAQPMEMRAVSFGG
ncbi:MAG: 4Fe-4S binding protein [Anaerolineae bacterium]